MPDLNLRELARAVDGILKGDGELRVRGVTADSRRLRPGELFVALAGTRTDGHRFLEAAARAGAAAALVQEDRGPRPAGLPVVVVPDPLRALGELAHAVLRRRATPVVGITGTVGKTTAKDFLAALLGGPGAGVHAAPASFNSECGLPLAILNAPAEARLLILEYGVNAPGEMDRLLEIAAPTEGWITAVTEVHLEGMGSLETVAREKLRLFQALPESGSAWTSPQTLELLRAFPSCRTALQGLAARLRAEAPGAEGPLRVLEAEPGRFRLEVEGAGVLDFPVVAAHEAALAATAARLALSLGARPEELRERAAGLQRPPGRLSLHRFGALEVLDDAYNASPAAMEAALEVLASWPGARRRVAVLGTMHELGLAAEDRHRRIGRTAAGLDLDLLLGVGEGGAWIAEEAARSGSAAEILTAADAVSAAALLVPRLRAGDLVLLKASRAEGLEQLLAPLEQAAPGLPPRAGRLLRMPGRDAPLPGLEALA